jgi:hypothetical protein
MFYIGGRTFVLFELSLGLYKLIFY